MEEDPKQHDFDQRHDGPIQPRRSVQIAPEARRTVSDDHAATRVKKSKTEPITDNQFNTHPEQHDEQPPRRSTQIGRAGTWGRQSRDFDVRRDGPFGRPSIQMNRRRSSQWSTGVTSPTIPTAGDTVASPTEDTKEDGAAPSDQFPPSVETMQSSDAAFEPEPPPLNYTLNGRKFSIFWFWSLILIDSIAMPIVLYFTLWYLTDLSPNTVFSIVTAALGGASIIEYVVRFWRLWKKGSTCRVIGARRAYLDWFHWNFSFAWIVVMIELIVGTIPKKPPIRLLSMPLSTMTFTFGIQVMLIDILAYFHVPAPVRISSIPKGAQLRPGIYFVIEDVCAVDGSGGTEFRENFNKRYEASHIFRTMLRRLDVFWATGALGAATLTTILVFTLSKDAAYVCGWSIPFVWAGIWTPITIWYVKRKLREEKKQWAEEVATKTNA